MARWSIIIFGVIALLALGRWRYETYNSGLDFQEELVGPSLMMLGIYIVAIVVVLVACIELIVQFKRKKFKGRWLLFLFIPLMCVGSLWVPTPGFVEGLTTRVKGDLNQEQLLNFAKVARGLSKKESDIFRSDGAEIIKLKEAFPTIFKLTDLPPRVDINEESVTINYRVALVGYWGISINDLGNDSILSTKEKVKVTEAFEKTWVFSSL